jgi:hypothetical protein
MGKIKMFRPLLDTYAADAEEDTYIFWDEQDPFSVCTSNTREPQRRIE